MKSTTLLLLLLMPFWQLKNDDPPVKVWDFDAQMKAYFEAETQKLADNTRRELQNISDWEAYRKQAQTELMEMLGLSPLPEKTPLNAVVTGTIEHELFRVEKVHFQAMPGLYVTGNLYIPKNVTKPLPAVLYVCGHATVKKDGYNYGAKVNYHHHPAWFARNGYVCLIIDTLQLAEIEGIHHGTYRYDRWWWISRGYTPAGVEAWHGIRAVDYLISRPEVDKDRIGITGRSGGGVCSWWGAGVDDRLKVIVPVAGITDLENQVVDGCVEGHCDCMFMVNTYRWDYPKIAALVAPRPLLISNSDRDDIFPIDGVFRTYQQVRGVYEKLEVGPDLALNTVAGGHKDIQPLRVHAFQWFNHYFRGDDELIMQPAVKYFEAEQLRVFDQLPEDEINTTIDEVFVPLAPSLKQQLEQKPFPEAKSEWMEILKTKVFNGWPQGDISPTLTPVNTPKRSMEIFALQTDEHTRLPLMKITGKGSGREVIILDDDNWTSWANALKNNFGPNELWSDLPDNPQAGIDLEAKMNEKAEIILISTRGSGLGRFTGDEKKYIQIRRRYYLLGQTLQGMQTWDILQAFRAMEGQDWLANGRIKGEGNTGVIAAYAGLFFETPLNINIKNPPFSHHDGPVYQNVLRFMDIPAALLMASEKHKISLEAKDKKMWQELRRAAGRGDGFKLDIR